MQTSEFFSKNITIVVFDLGGVLAYIDDSELTGEELNLLHIYRKYMNIGSVDKKDRELLEYAKSKMVDIYLKMYKLNEEAIPVLDMLQYEKIKPSVWTNNTPYINSWFESSTLSRYIKSEYFINSFYLGYDKPDVRFYMSAMAILEECHFNIMFLDDNKNNVDEAQNCGIFSVEYNMHMSLKSTVLNAIRARRLI